eukprot:g4534.t1
MAKSLSPILARVPHLHISVSVSLSEVVHELLEKYMQRRKALRTTRDHVAAFQSAALKSEKNMGLDEATEDTGDSNPVGSVRAPGVPANVLESKVPGMGLYARERQRACSAAEEKFAAAVKQFDGTKRKLIHILDELRLGWRKTVHNGHHHDYDCIGRQENIGSHAHGDHRRRGLASLKQRRVSTDLGLQGMTSKVPAGWGKRGMGLGVGVGTPKSGHMTGLAGGLAPSVPDSVVSKVSGRNSIDDAEEPRERLASSLSHTMSPPEPVASMSQIETESVLVEAMRFCESAYFDLVACTYL